MGVKLLEHCIQIVEKVLEVRIKRSVNLIRMQFGLIPGKGTTDALLIVRRIKEEEYQEKRKKLYMYVLCGFEEGI